MKALLIIKSMAQMIVFFFLNAVIAYGDEKKGDVTSIMLIRLDMGWTITVNKDGSGGVSYGSSIFDNAAFQDGTVDFTKLLSSLEEAPLIQKNEDGGEIIQVVVNRKEEKSGPATSRKALKCWVKLCRKIEPKLHSMKPEHFNKLKKDRPLMKAKEKNLFIEEKTDKTKDSKSEN